MRVALFAVAVALAACAPAVHPSTTASYDEELGPKKKADDVSNTSVSLAAPRGLAPVGKGTRSGTIDRARLTSVLDAGPGNFLRQVEVTAHLDGQRFVGWQFVQLVDPASPLAAVDLAPGDVLLAVNGSSVSRPDQLQAMWDGLRTANDVTAELWRGDAKLELHFTVEPKI